MSKSFCIKTNNNEILNYLLNEFENVNLKNIYISRLKFKLYNNFIVHYTGKDLNSFYNTFANILSPTIINFYEKSIVKHVLSCNYFYFSDMEQQKILEIVKNYLYKRRTRRSKS